MASYSYLFADLLTNAAFGDIPLVGDSFGRVLNDAGSFKGEIVLDDERVRALDPISATEPNRRVVYVVRDGVLLPPVYWLRTRRYSSSTRRLAVGGSELWTYFRQRLIRATLTFGEVDQGEIVETIIDALQALPSGDVALAVSGAMTGVLRDRTYYGYELKQAAEAIEQLSEVIDGFDFSVDASGDLSAPDRTLVVSYPRRGIEGFATDLLFDLPGNVLDYEWPEDGTRQGNAIVGAGGGEGDDMLVSVATDPDSLAAGFPLLERPVTYKDIRDQEYLDSAVEGDLENLRDPVVVPALTVRGDVDPIVGSYDTGDDLRLAIRDDRFPDGLEQYARIVGYEVTPEDAESALETVTLELGEASA